MKDHYTRFVVIAGLCAALVLISLVARVGAQKLHRTINVKALDGRNGKPIKCTQLLIFGGGTAEEVRQHAEHFDLLTDENGNAKLTLDSDSPKFLQVWVNGMTLCQSHPNSASFRVEQLLTQGSLGPNECGKLRASAVPGQLIVFARPATFRQKMAR